MQQLSVPLPLLLILTTAAIMASCARNTPSKKTVVDGNEGAKFTTCPLQVGHMTRSHVTAASQLTDRVIADSSNSMTHLLLNATFSCRARVRAWTYFRTRSSPRVFASVWRKEPSPDEYFRLVGMTVLPAGEVGLHRVVIVSARDRIVVERGDFIGFHYSGAEVYRFNEQGALLVDSLVHGGHSTSGRSDGKVDADKDIEPFYLTLTAGYYNENFHVDMPQTFHTSDRRLILTRVALQAEVEYAGFGINRETTGHAENPCDDQTSTTLDCGSGGSLEPSDDNADATAFGRSVSVRKVTDRTASSGPAVLTVFRAIHRLPTTLPCSSSTQSSRQQQQRQRLSDDVRRRRRQHHFPLASGRNGSSNGGVCFDDVTEYISAACDGRTDCSIQMTELATARPAEVSSSGRSRRRKQLDDDVLCHGGRGEYLDIAYKCFTADIAAEKSAVDLPAETQTEEPTTTTTSSWAVTEFSETLDRVPVTKQVTGTGSAKQAGQSTDDVVTQQPPTSFTTTAVLAASFAEFVPATSEVIFLKAVETSSLSPNTAEVTLPAALSATTSTTLPALVLHYGDVDPVEFGTKAKRYHVTTSAVTASSTGAGDVISVAAPSQTTIGSLATSESTKRDQTGLSKYIDKTPSLTTLTVTSSATSSANVSVSTSAVTIPDINRSSRTSISVSSAKLRELITTTTTTQTTSSTTTTKNTAQMLSTSPAADVITTGGSTDQHQKVNSSYMPSLIGVIVGVISFTLFLTSLVTCCVCLLKGKRMRIRKNIVQSRVIEEHLRSNPIYSHPSQRVPPPEYMSAMQTGNGMSVAHSARGFNSTANSVISGGGGGGAYSTNGGGSLPRSTEDFQTSSAHDHHHHHHHHQQQSYQPHHHQQPHRFHGAHHVHQQHHQQQQQQPHYNYHLYEKLDSVLSTSQAATPSPATFVDHQLTGGGTVYAVLNTPNSAVMKSATADNANSTAAGAEVSLPASDIDVTSGRTNQQMGIPTEFCPILLIGPNNVVPTSAAPSVSMASDDGRRRHVSSDRGEPELGGTRQMVSMRSSCWMPTEVVETAGVSSGAVLMRRDSEPFCYVKQASANGGALGVTTSGMMSQSCLCHPKGPEDTHQPLTSVLLFAEKVPQRPSSHPMTGSDVFSSASAASGTRQSGGGNYEPMTLGIRRSTTGNGQQGRPLRPPLRRLRARSTADGAEMISSQIGDGGYVIGIDSSNL